MRHNDITGTDDIDDNNDITEMMIQMTMMMTGTGQWGREGAPCKHHRDMCPESSEVSCVMSQMMLVILMTLDSPLINYIL